MFPWQVDKFALVNRAMVLEALWSFASSFLNESKQSLPMAFRNFKMRITNAYYREGSMSMCQVGPRQRLFSSGMSGPRMLAYILVEQ